MLKRILRAAAPILLLLLGIALVVYGARAHVVPVVLKPEEPEKGEEASPKTDEPEAPPEEQPEMPPPRDPWMSPPRDPWMGGPPADPWMGPPPGEPGMDEPPAESPGHEPAPKKPPEEKIIAVIETELIRDVTVGGVTQGPSGQIFRTYSSAERPPSLCPT